MPSLRSKFCRLLTKYLVAPKFNPQKTIDEARKGMESLTRLSSLPSKTTVEKIKIDSISAEWVYSNIADEDKVILYFHGGGYNLCSPNTHRELAANISIASGAKMLIPDYRLAPENPFPCAVEDAVSAYRWLLDTGLTEKNIAISGDSAGGGLAIATVISLRDAGDTLPASIATISPWTDLEMSGNSIKTNAEIEPMLNLQSMKIMASNYIGNNDPRSTLISPNYADLSGFPPFLIHVGSDEMLLDDSKRIAEKAQDAEVDVTLKIYDQMWHVFHLNAKMMPEAKNAISDIGSFVRKCFEN